MIELYTWTTPNGRKVPIMLEELGLPYALHMVDLGKGEQHRPEFLAISPNNKIPALVDRDGIGGRSITLFESGAILTYLADKTGKLLSREPQARYEALEWTFWQVGGVGPMFGQLIHFTRMAPAPVPYAIERFTAEARRLLGVLDRRLSDREHIAGEYSIADIATYPWLVALRDRVGELLEPHAHVQRWMDAVGARPAVQRGMSFA